MNDLVDINKKFLLIKKPINKYFFLSILFFSISCKCNFTHDKAKIISENFKLNRDELISDLKEFTLAPHPFGSIRQSILSDYLVSRLKNISGLKIEKQGFKSLTPNPNYSEQNSSLTLEKAGQNIIARKLGKENCKIILASHYDTKEVEGVAYVGANDSGSSSAALFQIVAYLNQLETMRCGFEAIWFDGEEATLQDWHTGEIDYPEKIQDHTYGSRFYVSQIEKDHSKIERMILLDMIGSPNLTLANDKNSDEEMKKVLKNGIEILNLKINFSENLMDIQDDHIPFMDKKILSLNIIDFTHLENWHKHGDEIKNLDLDSIESASKLAVFIYSYLN